MGWVEEDTPSETDWLAQVCKAEVAAAALGSYSDIGDRARAMCTAYRGSGNYKKQVIGSMGVLVTIKVIEFLGGQTGP